MDGCSLSKKFSRDVSSGAEGTQRSGEKNEIQIGFSRVSGQADYDRRIRANCDIAAGE
jgi:hypothetical protein